MDLNNEGYFVDGKTELVVKPKDYSHLLSRKFIIAALAILSATILVACGAIADGVYATVVVSSITAYQSANVIQKNNANN